MGLFDDKKNVFTTIGAYTSLKQERKLPDSTNLYPSVNNKKEALPFLLDMLKTVVGSDALKGLTGELFTNFIDNTEPKLKEALGKQLIQYNAGIPLPNYFKDDGVIVPVKDIDVYGKLKTNPNSDVGSLLYDNSQPNFDSVAYSAIVNEGDEKPYNNLLIKYNSATDSFTFRANPASVTTNTTIGDYFGDFVNDTVIVNKKEVLTNVMNAFYGSVTAQQGKTVDEVYKELQISKLIEQLIADENASFELSQEDFDALLAKARELINGVVFYDMGCGLLGASLPFSGLTNLINQISGSTDPHATSNAVLSTVDQSLSNTQEIADENKETIKDGFFQRIIRIVQQIFAQLMVTSPQIRALMAIKSAFENGGIVQLGNPIDDLKKFKIFIICIIKDLVKIINEFIFKIVMAFLVALLAPIVKKIIREKINQYIGLIKSLVTT